MDINPLVVGSTSAKLMQASRPLLHRHMNPGFVLVDLSLNPQYDIQFGISAVYDLFSLPFMILLRSESLEHLSILTSNLLKALYL